MDPRTDAIAFLYLTFAHATDGALTGGEMRLVADKLRGWRPDAALDVIGAQIKTAVERYKKVGTREQKLAEAQRMAGELAGLLNPAERAQVMAELQEIAEVDGTPTADEAAFLETVRARLG